MQIGGPIRAFTSTATELAAFVRQGKRRHRTTTNHTKGKMDLLQQFFRVFRAF